MNDTTIITLLLFGAATTLVGIGIQLFSDRRAPEDSTRLHSLSVKTNMLILTLLVFSISIVIIQSSIETSSSKSSVIDAKNRFEGDIREDNQ